MGRAGGGRGSSSYSGGGSRVGGVFTPPPSCSVYSLPGIVPEVYLVGGVPAPAVQHFVH